MSNIKEEMERARELIQQKRYDEARAILRRVDHPKAQEWLIKLDTLDPPKPSGEMDDFLDFQPTRGKKSSPAANNSGVILGMGLLLPLAGIGLCVACCLLGFGWFILTADVSNTSSGGCSGGDCDLSIYNSGTRRGEIRLGGTVSGTISDFNEVDVWTFTVSSTAPVTVILNSASFDEQLYVYGPAGKNLYGEDGVFEDELRMTFDPPIAGTYSLAVTEWGFVFDGGDYTLTVTQ